MATKREPEKLDLFRENKNDYLSPKKPVLVDIGPAKYLTIAGTGKPGGDAFKERIGLLYAAAFTAKMTSKAAGRDYAVCKLEALWWAEGDLHFETAKAKDVRYQFLIRTPDFIGKRELAAAREAILQKGKAPKIGEVALERLGEGRCVQMLHVGPYETERESVDLMRAHAEAEGYELAGRHHEVYLSDPRRVPAARLKTILRLPVREA